MRNKYMKNNCMNKKIIYCEKYKMQIKKQKIKKIKIQKKYDSICEKEIFTMNKDWKYRKGRKIGKL